MNDWIDEWYSELERQLTNYKRPEDWKERFDRLVERQSNPVRNQYEGLRSKGESHGD